MGRIKGRIHEQMITVFIRRYSDRLSDQAMTSLPLDYYFLQLQKFLKREFVHPINRNCKMIKRLLMKFYAWYECVVSLKLN